MVLTMWRILMAVFLFGPPQAEGKAIHAFAGPYVAYTERFYNCEGNYNWGWGIKATHFNPMKPNELQRISGWVNATTETFMDTGWFKAVLDLWNNNMWKENAFIFNLPTKGCSALRRILPVFVVRVLRQNATGDCAVTPALYEVHDMPMSWNPPTIPIMAYGKYRLRVRGGVAGNSYPQACLVVEINLIPKVN